MQNSLIWELIRQFSTQEVRDFRRFMKSPYFNTRLDLLDLFDYLIRFKDESEVLPEREVVFASVFPNKKFATKDMRLLLSYLFRLLEQFLQIEEQGKDKSAQKSTLMTVYKNRNLPRHLRKTLNQAKKLSKQNNQKHPEFYLHNYYIEREEYALQTKEGRTKALNLQELEDNLDAAFVSFKLRQACLARSHEAVFNTQYDTRLINLLLESAQLEAFKNIPAISVYFHCYNALYKEPTDTNFRIFREELIAVTQFFPQAEVRVLYLLALNYCIKKINKSEQIYLQEALDLYKTGLENNLLLEHGVFLRHSFNNIVGIALRLDDFAWTETFVKDYKNALPEQYRTTVFHLNSARLNYAQKNYDEALLHLQKSDYRDILDNMVAKILQMKIYYETEQFDLLDSHLNTLKMYIRRNKKISYHYENWRNIIQYMQKITEVNPFDKEAKSKLEIAIKKEDILTERTWLLKQLA